MVLLQPPTASCLGKHINFPPTTPSSSDTWQMNNQPRNYAIIIISRVTDVLLWSINLEDDKVLLGAFAPVMDTNEHELIVVRLFFVRFFARKYKNKQPEVSLWKQFIFFLLRAEHSSRAWGKWDLMESIVFICFATMCGCMRWVMRAWVVVSSPLCDV